MAQTSLNSTGVASSGALSLQSNGTTEAIGISTGQVATLAQNPILTSGTVNGLAFLNASKVLTTGSALVFDGTNLGVGVTPSATGGAFKAFQVGNGAAIFGQNNSSSVVHVAGNVYFDSSNIARYIASTFAQRYRGLDGAHEWYTAPSGTAGNAIAEHQAMTLDASGNLLVGRTSTINADRLLAKGTTTDSTASAISAYASNDGELFRVRNDGAFFTGGASVSPYNNTTATVANVVVNSNGSLARGGVSALKYKQDIRDLENIDVDKFRAVRYKSNCPNDDQTIDYFGFIADEVDAAGIKELVTYGENGEIEGFQYERLTAVLLKEIQSLRQRLAALESN